MLSQLCNDRVMMCVVNGRVNVCWVMTMAGG